MYGIENDASYVGNIVEAYNGVVGVEHPPSILKIPCGGHQCNAKCSFCPVPHSNLKPHGKERTLSIYERIGAFVEKADNCCIVDWCEPMLCQHLPELLEYLNQKTKKSAILSVVTNGIHLDWRSIDIMAARRNRFLAVSLNASDRDTYKQVMGVDRFEKVCENVRRLKKENLEVRLSIVISMENFDRFPDFVTLAKELQVDAVILQDMFIWTDACFELSCTNDPKSVRERIQMGLDLAAELDLPVLQYLPSSYTKQRETRFSCFEPWTNFNVANDGEVRLCCYSPLSLGNVFKNEPEDIWKENKDFLRIRQGLSSGKLTGECSKCYRRWENADPKLSLS